MKTRSISIEDKLWFKALDKARKRRESLSAVVRKFLKWYSEKK